jgi:GntR family transcriptional regulator
MDSTAKVDRSDAVPLYHQIFLMLRDDIVTGQRAHGTLLPTEDELAGLHAVSRITARRALEELANHRFVERRRRTGTRVIYRAPTRPIEANLDQAVESLLAFGRNTGVRVIELKEGPASAAVAAQLGLATGDAVMRAVRIRLIDNEPLGEVVSHVPAVLGRGISRNDLTTTPMLELLRNAGRAIGGGSQTISAALAGPHLSALLGIDVRAPILRVERTVKDDAGTPLLFTVASYRSDRYRIGIDLHSPARAVAEVL